MPGHEGRISPRHASGQTFLLFVAPAARALRGLPPAQPLTMPTLLTAPLRSPAGKRSYLPAVLDRAAGSAAPAARHGAHRLCALARANALIIVPEEVTGLRPGDTVDVLELAP